MKMTAKQLIAFLTLTLLGAASGQAGSLSIGPGLFMLQDVPPGQTLDMKEIGGPQFRIPNDGEEEAEYVLRCAQPADVGMLNWEAGYEPIPSPEWCTVDNELLVVPAGETGNASLRVMIPDEPESYNRRFVLAVALSPRVKSGFGFGLAVASRVQIETTVSDSPSNTGGDIALAPARADLQCAPGESVSASVKVINNTEAPQELAPLRISDIYPDDSKHARYISNGWQGLLYESWLDSMPEPLELAPGQMREITLNLTVPDGVSPGSYEELLFLKGAGEDAPVAFIRIRCEVVKPSDEQEEE